MRLSSRPPLARLALIDREIRKGTWPTCNRLAGLLDVGRRTVLRDLDFLRDRLHAPLEFDRPHNGYCYRDPTFCLPYWQMSEGDLVAVFLAERLLQEYRHTPYAPALAAAFAKITAALPDPVTIDLAHLAEAVSLRHQGADPGEAGRFALLHKAVCEGRQLELLYWSASRDQTARRVVDPYHLASIDGDWFLIAFCHLREDIRMFAPGRIRELKETGVSFQRPADFHAAAYLDAGFRKMRGTGAPVRVRLRFRPAAARYVCERVCHPTQELRDLAGGRLEMTLRLNHLLEVKRWVMSLGPDCEVLEPEQLRSEVAAELLQAVRQYGRV
jgi:predicted DNA-binding transcriptional regulator YafY